MKHDIKRLKVLAYHSVNDVVRFEKQLKYIKYKYSVIGIDDLYKAIENQQKLPENPLLITFDDGDVSVYHNAFPLLIKYQFPAALFVITNLIDSQTPFWWKEIQYYLGKKHGNEKVWEVKTWSNKRRENYLIYLRKSSKKPMLKYEQLSTQQLLEMQSGKFGIANHSHTHPMFDQCTKEELEKEMKRSTTILEDLGFTPYIFAYPNGNYLSESEDILKKWGIKLSFLFDHKINKEKINPLRISRLAVDDTTPIWKFKFILNGWHSKILPLTRGIRKIFQILK